MHIALPDGSVLSRGWAAAALSTWLPGLHWIGWATVKMPATGAALDWLYGQIAGRRSSFAGLVPDVEPVERPGEP